MKNIKDEISSLNVQASLIRMMTEELKAEMREIERKIQAREKFLSKQEITPKNVIEMGGFYGK